MYKDKSYYHISSNPSVEILRYNYWSKSIDPAVAPYDNGNWKQYIKATKVAYFGQIPNYEFRYNSKNLQSFSFSRSVNEFYGTFDIQIKEDYTQNYSLLDLVEPLDVVIIYPKSTDRTYRFVGLVDTISFGATAGTYNKVISISGSSASILFEMLKFATDATAMSFFVKSAGNITIQQRLTQLVVKGKNQSAYKLSEAFNAIYSTFIDYLIKKDYSHIATSGLYNIILGVFGLNKDFIDAGNLTFRFQTEANLFNQDEVNVYSFLRNLLPDTVYEVFERPDSMGQLKIVIREKPYDITDWENLNYPVELDPALITDYTLTRNNKQVFTCFYGIVSGTSLDTKQYIMNGANAQGNPAYSWDEDKCKVYGYKPLTVKFVGYSKARNGSENELVESFKQLSKRLKGWYSHIDEMYSGDVTIIDAGYANQTTGKTIRAQIGERVKICGGEFYVTSEKHTWQYGDVPKINYSLERGGIYSLAKANTNKSEDGFSPITNISSAFAELLKEEGNINAN